MHHLINWLQLNNPLYRWFQHSKDKALRPLARLAHQLKLTPDHITVLSLLLGLTSAAVLPWHYWLAVGILLLSSLCDALDGTLARLIQQRSSYGAQLDYWCDVTITIGLFWAIVYRLHEPWWLIGLGLFILLLGVNVLLGSPLKLASHRMVVMLCLLGQIPHIALGYVSGYAIIMIGIFLLQTVRGKLTVQPSTPDRRR